MVSAASEAINFRKKNPAAIDEESYQHISDYIEKIRVKDEKIKIAMIAAASKAFELTKKNPDVSERDILKDVMDEIPGILYNLGEE